MQFVAKVLWEEHDISVSSLKINKTNTNTLYSSSSYDSFNDDIDVKPM